MAPDKANAAGSPSVFDLHDRGGGQSAPAVSVRLTRSGEWAILEVSGEMDLQVVPLVSELLAAESVRVVFELNEVTFMDAGGLRALVDSQAKSILAGGCIRLAAPSSQARRLLRLTGTDTQFQTFDTLDDAVTAAVSVRPERAS